MPLPLSLQQPSRHGQTASGGPRGIPGIQVKGKGKGPPVGNGSNRQQSNTAKTSLKRGLFNQPADSRSNQ
jgi:hypothetical protein